MSARATKGAVALGVGVLLLVVVFVAKLGWTGFFPAVAILAVGAWLVTRGEDDSGPRTMFAYCMALVVIFLGVGWAHPQRWASPGWKLGKPGAVLLGRHGTDALIYDSGYISSRSLATGSLLWRFHTRGSKAIINSSGILIQSDIDPTQADYRSLGTGEAGQARPWPGNTANVLVLSAGKPLAQATGKPTAAQIAKMPKLTSRERAIATVGWEGIAARLDTAVDPTGHHYTRLDIVDGPTSETYRVSGATGLQLYQGVLVVDSAHPHVIGLLRHAPKEA